MFLVSGKNIMEACWLATKFQDHTKLVYLVQVMTKCIRTYKVLYLYVVPKLYLYTLQNLK